LGPGLGDSLVMVWLFWVLGQNSNDAGVLARYSGIVKVPPPRPLEVPVPSPFRRNFKQKLQTARTRSRAFNMLIVFIAFMMIYFFWSFEFNHLTKKQILVCISPIVAICSTSFL
jgi:hypothetical protein